MTDREIIRSTFQGLELEGVEAREDYWCCNTCALSAFDKRGVEEFVYFHEQNLDAFDAEGNLRDTLHLGWAGEAAARKTVAALEKEGYAVEFTGDPARKIEVRRGGGGDGR